MPFLRKTKKLSGRDAKKFYKQMTEYGIPKKTTQKTVQLYEE